MYCCPPPTVSVMFCGLTVITLMVLLLTVSLAMGETTLPELAVIFVLPTASAVA